MHDLPVRAALEKHFLFLIQSGLIALGSMKKSAGDLHAALADPPRCPGN
jgi:hypothetical protein